MSSKYNSAGDTMDHIARVRELLDDAATELIRRGLVHDRSKLRNPEKDLFDEYTPLLKDSVYGSDHYKELLAGLKPALDHHYANNSHHPEHYDNGVDGMDLFDLIEMAMDWKAASERHSTGDIYESLRINKDRFKLTDQLQSILENTYKRLGYTK